METRGGNGARYRGRTRQTDHWTVVLADSSVDLVLLQQIELSAAAIFATDILPDSMRSDAMEVRSLDRAREEGLLWVAMADGSTPVGFAICEHEGRYLHLRELDVAPQWHRRGVGSALLAAVQNEAVRIGAVAVTLTTFASVAWNAPMYARRGFVVVDGADTPTFLTARLEHEAALGLRDRVAMAWRTDRG